MLDLLFTTLLINSTVEPLMIEFQCASFESFDRTLKEKYHEEPVILARQKGSRGTFMIYSNQNKTSFTLLIAYPDKTCLVGTGNQLIIRDINNNY